MSRAAVSGLRSILARQGAGGEAWARGMATYPSQLAIRGEQAVQGGKGGRSSVSGMVVTIFGCSGFVGRYIAQSLGRVGCQLVLPYRCDELDVQHLRIMGDLGQVVMLPGFDPRDDASYERAVSRSNVVINLLGARQETWNYSYDEVHVEFAARAARAAAARGGAVQHFLNFSDIAAAADAPSARLRSHAAGEAAVREVLGDAVTTFRLAPVTGTEDYVFNTLARLAKSLPAVPLVEGGRQRLQPIWVRDVADSVFAALQDEAALGGGKTYALAGPAVHTLRGLAELTYDTIREPESLVSVPANVAAVAAGPLAWMAKNTPFRANAYFSPSAIQEQADADFTLAAARARPGGASLLTAQDLGVEPRSVTEGHPIEFLRFYRSGGYDVGALPFEQAPAARVPTASP